MSYQNNLHLVSHLYMYSRTTVLNLFLVMIGMFVLSSPTLAQSVADSFNPGSDGTILTSAIQPDGKILVGGGFGNLGGQLQENIGRLNPDGTLDMTFRPVVPNSVFALAVQPDGKILVGGIFVFINSVFSPGLGRLNPDGTLDLTFNPQAFPTYAIAIQPDGKIVIAGDFTFVSDQPVSRIARLNPDGTLDTSFNSSADSLIWSLGLQPDGKILVGGAFSTLGGQPRSGIGRLNADGTTDLTFNSGTDAEVRTVLIQPDGKIVVGGAFTMLGGQPRSRIGRLNADGTVDPVFNPGADGPVVSLALQTNGKIIAGGEPFFTLGGQPRTDIGRLNADGTIDPTFNPGALGNVHSIAIQTDGKIVVGGSFNFLGGQIRIFIGRVTNPDAAVENLSVDPFGTTLTWQRSGSSPEVQQVFFEQSTDGVNFTPLGNGTRIAGGWQLTGLTIPSEQNFFLRARGVGLGLSSSSHSLYESVVNVFLPCALPATVSGGGAICLGTPSLITVTVSGGVGPYTVTLDNGGGTQTGNGPVFNFPVTPAANTTYSIQSGSDSTGCAIVGTSSTTVTVKPLASVNPVTPPAICGGSPTSIALTSVPGGATLSWTIGPVTGTVTGQAAGSGSTISQTLNGSGTVTYLVTATLDGCPGPTTSIVQTVEPRATANAGPDQTVCASNPAVTLAGVIGGSASNGTWSGGAGTFNPGPGTLNAMYTPSAGEIAAGSVTLTLTTNDPAGSCGAGSDTVTISILDCTVSGLLMVADTTNNRVQRFDGTTWTVIGVGTVGSGNGQFRTPEAVAFDGTGRIYVADTGNNRIQWSTDAGTTWANFATLGSAPNQVRAPQGLTLDSNGNLYVSDTGNGRVVRFNGGVPGVATVIASNGSASGQVGSPRGLAIDAAFRLFVADETNSRILRISNANTVLTATTGTVIATKGTGLNQVMNPQGVTLEPNGTLYVADTGNSRVLRWVNANPNTSTTMALIGSQLGQVNRPEGVTVKFFQTGAVAGNLLLVVGDTMNNRIQGRFLPTGQSGQWSLIGAPNGSGTTVGRFRNPSKLQ